MNETCLDHYPAHCSANHEELHGYKLITGICSLFVPHLHQKTISILFLIQVYKRRLHTNKIKISNQV